MQIKSFTFTVFTPTYNRHKTLPDVYNCLCKQTFRDFEWLIIDDGSTDGTQELVHEWQKESNFSIVYVFQENGGKHRAFNKAVKIARGSLFLTLDSDDYCIPTALERLKLHWDQIGNKNQENFSGVSCLCMRKNGEIIGESFPSDLFDSNPIDLRNRYNITGEKWGFCRTDILRNYEYPEIEGEKYIAPSYVWNKVALKFLTRYVNEKLRIYEVHNDSITLKHSRIRSLNPLGSSLYYRTCIDYGFPLLPKLKASINFIRFSLHANNNIINIFRKSDRLLILVSIPFGYLVYNLDCIKFKFE